MTRPEYVPRISIGDASTVWLPTHPDFQVDPLNVQPTTLNSPYCVPRTELRESLVDGRRAWRLDSPTEVIKNIQRLEDPQARVVVTGQQPGFLGGPIFTLLKAITAVALAARLERQQGRPWIPVFWVASEDHDLDEVRALHLPSEDGTTIFQVDHVADRRPLSSYRVDARVQKVVDAVRSHFANRRHSGDVAALLQCYEKDRHLGSAFASFLDKLFGSRGLVVAAPEWLRALGRPIVQEALERPLDVLQCIDAGISEMREAGLRPQVRSRYPVFFLDDEGEGVRRRQHLTPENGGFRVDGSKRVLSTDEATALVENESDRFSTGVLLRAVVQQACLPVGLAVGGAAEINYFAQLGPLFRHYDLPATPMALRLHGALIEGKVARAMRRVAPETELVEALAQASDVPGLLRSEASDTGVAMARLRADLEDRLEKIVGHALTEVTLPEDQERRIRRSGEKLIDDLDRFARRLERVEAMADTERLTAAQTVWHALYPDGVAQERHWSALHFISKYGCGWIDELVDHVENEPDLLAHRWIYFED